MLTYPYNYSKRDIMNTPIDLKRECTNEFILLGLLYFATKHGLNLGRMQMVKLLWKFKDLTQDKLKLQAYYTEPYKDKHGRFNKEIYYQVNNLRLADFIKTSGLSAADQLMNTWTCTVIGIAH